MVHEEALVRLRSTLAQVRHDSPDPLWRIAAQIRDAKDAVISRYGPMFAPENVERLTAEDFKSFLLFKNNQHWDSIHRQGGWMTADMPALREALRLLVDESLPLRTRLNMIAPGTPRTMVRGLGRAVVTAILQVVYPDRYGVLNRTAEDGMKELGLWPEVSSSALLADKYEAVNRVLLETATALGVDLWTLDMLWWRIGRSSPPIGSGLCRTPSGSPETRLEANAAAADDADADFGLKGYLHEFLVDNWESISLAKDWALLEKDGEIVGSRYNTGEIGEIDLLARHRREDRWLVIELERNQSSDDTAGQLSRYMGWVRRNLASAGDQVEGLIICRAVDLKLRYALECIPNVRCTTYQVSFTLNPVPELGA